MVDQIIGMMVDSADAAGQWFSDIIDASGMLGVFLGCITVVLTVRFFIVPFTGRGLSGALFNINYGSDRARSSKNRSSDNE